MMTLIMNNGVKAFVSLLLTGLAVFFWFLAVEHGSTESPASREAIVSVVCLGAAFITMLRMASADNK